MKLSHYDFIIGIDQVGAVNSKRTPKVLPISIITLDEHNNWKLFTRDKGDNPLELKNLNYKHIYDLVIKNFSIDIQFCNIFIVIDTVLGLPDLINKNNDTSSKFIRNIIKRSALENNWGLKAGEKFFNQILKQAGLFGNTSPLRKIEKKMQANSVFKTTPFQRNIQTGTFRIWRNLANFPLCKISIFPYDKVSLQKPHILIAEGYPTLAWKILNKTNRTSQDFSALSEYIIEVQDIELIKDALPDQKDAIILSLLGWRLLKDRAILSEINASEGTILGYHSI